MNQLSCIKIKLREANGYLHRVARNIHEIGVNIDSDQNLALFLFFKTRFFHITYDVGDRLTLNCSKGHLTLIERRRRILNVAFETYKTEVGFYNQN